MRTSWCERYGTGNTFGGGLKIRTTLDLDLQKAAEQAITGRLGGVGPSAALVAIDNDTGGIRAMVGGARLRRSAVQPRHAGATPARLGVQAVHARGRARERHPPGRTFVSAPKTLRPGPRGDFTVENYEDRYTGVDLAGGRHDDVGQLRVRGGRLQGRHRARSPAWPAEMGVRTPISQQPRDGARRAEARA